VQELPSKNIFEEKIEGKIGEKDEEEEENVSSYRMTLRKG